MSSMDIAAKMNLSKRTVEHHIYQKLLDNLHRKIQYLPKKSDKSEPRLSIGLLKIAASMALFGFVSTTSQRVFCLKAQKLPQ